jgi:hypothetical protein
MIVVVIVVWDDFALAISLTLHIVKLMSQFVNIKPKNMKS